MSKFEEIYDLIQQEFALRNKVRPTVEEAILWLITELAEVAEIQLDRGRTWVRNNPENKSQYSKEHLAEELGDVIYMALVAGMVAEVDPLQAMEYKVKAKILAAIRAEQ